MKPVRQSVKFAKGRLDKDAIKVVDTIHAAGFEVYLVGGCVRDLLLDLEPKDFDIVTSAKPEQVRKLFKRSRLIGRRFRLVHVMFGARHFIEVATFRSGKVQTAESGVIVRDNCYGRIEDDVLRRDFNINALYYDVQKQQVIDYVGGIQDLKAQEIHIIGNAKLRFEQDPVRMIRAIRFSVKTKAKVSAEIQTCLFNQASLLSHIAPARLYEECLKLFHNEYAFEVYQQLEKYGLLKFLFAQTQSNNFIKKALLNTADRIKNNKSITPAFLFAVFLWQAQNTRFAQIKKIQKSHYLAINQASEEVIIEQIKQVSLPRWLSNKVKCIWIMQSKLESKNPKKIKELLHNPQFRMAYDFLLLRSQSINPELIPVADFWTQIQTTNKRG